MINTKLITNNKLNITEKLKGTGKQKKIEVICSEQCSSDKDIEENKYIGHIGKQLLEHFSKHRYVVNQAILQRASKTISRKSQFN